METNNEILKLMYENAEMGSSSTTTLINLIKNTDNKIKCILEPEIEKFNDFMMRIEDHMEEEDVKSLSALTKMGSEIGIRIETLKDNSDTALAQMMIEGFTMGIVDIESEIKKYDKVASKKVIKLAKEYLKFLQKEITKLKDYL